MARTDASHSSEFVEVESGRKADRPELAKALNLAKITGSTLIVATMSRLTRGEGSEVARCDCRGTEHPRYLDRSGRKVAPSDSQQHH